MRKRKDAEFFRSRGDAPTGAEAVLGAGKVPMPARARPSCACGLTGLQVLLASRPRPQHATCNQQISVKNNPCTDHTRRLRYLRIAAVHADAAALTARQVRVDSKSALRPDVLKLRRGRTPRPRFLFFRLRAE
jgi:hypothetical protein